MMIVAASHTVIVHQRIYDRFLGGLHHTSENRIHEIVRDGLNRMCHRIRIGNVRIRSGERDEQIAGTVPGNAASAGKPERSAPGQALQLSRQQRRVGRNDNDDRAGFLLVNRAGNFPAHGNAGNGELRPAPAIRLHKNADRVGARGASGFFGAPCCMRLVRLDLDFVATQSRSLP